MYFATSGLSAFCDVDAASGRCIGRMIRRLVVMMGVGYVALSGAAKFSD